MEQEVEINNGTLSDEELSKYMQNVNSVVKTLFAIMNEEENIDAYNDKTPEEMVDIVKLVDARFPEKKMASYDPLYTMFGQVFRNGYNTFGVDFIKILLRRTDEVPAFTLKGLNDIIENQAIMNDNATVIISVLLKILIEAPEEDRLKLKEAIESGKELTDVEFLDKYFKEVEDEVNNDIINKIKEEN